MRSGCSYVDCASEARSIASVLKTMAVSSLKLTGSEARIHSPKL